MRFGQDEATLILFDSRRSQVAAGTFVETTQNNAAKAVGAVGVGLIIDN